MRILFVENHRVFANLTAKRLLSDYEVKIVPSLAEARNALRDKLFDLILIDYDLDDGKGAELVEELQTLPNRPFLIGVSAHDEGNSAILIKGADAVCRKNDFPLKIGEIISRFLSKHNSSTDFD